MPHLFCLATFTQLRSISSVVALHSLNGLGDGAGQVKEEGWWLVVSDEAESELLALKRLSFSSSTTARLTFPAAAAAAAAGVQGGEHRTKVGGSGCIVLRLISDSYLGLDQRHTVRWGGSDATGATAVAGN